MISNWELAAILIGGIALIIFNSILMQYLTKCKKKENSGEQSSLLPRVNN